MVHVLSPLLRLLAGLFSAVILVPSILTGAAHAAPCALVEVDPRGVSRALQRLRRPPPPPDRPGIWRVLVPRRVGVTLRDQSYDGVGWYAGSTGTESERGLFGTTKGYSVQVQWDLAPLFRDGPPRADPLVRSERLERVASRIAAVYRVLGKARSAARGLTADDPACAALKPRAAAAVMVLRAVLGRPVASPDPPPTSRSRPRPGAPSARPPAAPRPPDPSRRR